MVLLRICFPWISIFIICVVIGGVAGISVYQVNITRQEAEKIAYDELVRYCKNKNLSLENFVAFHVNSQQGSLAGYLLGKCGTPWRYPWILETQSQGQPRHTFSVAINQYGVVSIDSMKEFSR